MYVCGSFDSGQRLLEEMLRTFEIKDWSLFGQPGLNMDDESDDPLHPRPP